MKAAHHPPYAPEFYELTSSNVSSYNTGCVCVTHIGNTSSKTYTVEPNRGNNSLKQTQLLIFARLMALKWFTKD